MDVKTTLKIVSTCTPKTYGFCLCSQSFPFVPFGSVWFRLVPFGSVSFPLVPFGSHWFRFGPVIILFQVCEDLFVQCGHCGAVPAPDVETLTTVGDRAD